jgi:hypothetical protein
MQRYEMNSLVSDGNNALQDLGSTANVWFASVFTLSLEKL